MGCNCVSSPSRKLDEILASLHLREVTYKEIGDKLKNLKKNPDNTIDEQTFQKFFNEYLISNKYPMYNDDLLNFWFNFYRNKPTKYHNVYINFTFFFLSRNQYNGINFVKSKKSIESEEMDYFKLIFNNYRYIRYGNETLKFLSYSDLNFFLEDYIHFVTQTSIKHFSHLLDEETTKLVEWRLNEDRIFGDNLVSVFIKNTFFNDVNNFDDKIDIEKFIYSHWHLLKDDSEIRRLFFEYLNVNQD
jgi:hypothetical protein